MKRITDEKIISNNTKIAKFMDRIVVTDAQVCNYEVPDYPNGIVIDFSSYHSEWNSLMPVVRKIVEICIEDEEFFMSDEYTSILETVPLAIIEDAYKVVLEFIDMYNECE
jgi:hypothetical protein